MFGRVAHRYDLLNHLLSFGTDVLWRRKAVRLIAPTEGERNLDLCSGTGDLALEVHRQSRGKNFGIAADFTFEMLAIGKRKFQKKGASIREATADGLRLPFRSEVFDTVSVGFGVRNFENLEQGLAEIWRVLRPGGRLLVLEFAPGPRGPFSLFIRRYLDSVLPRIGAFISGDGYAYRYLPDSVGQWPEPEALAARLEKAGFLKPGFTILTFGIAAIHVARKGDRA